MSATIKPVPVGSQASRTAGESIDSGMHFSVRHVCGALLLGLLAGCGPAAKVSGKQVPHVVLRDVHFYSVSLRRTVPYRIYLPEAAAEHAVPSVYLLHGAGADYRDWSVSSNVQPLATAGYALIMPEGETSYFLNSASARRDQYEDFVTRDLIADVEARFPVDRRASRRAIIGVSMGGFGALTIALHHPSVFAFVGALSAPLDAARRPFAWRRFGQSMRLREVFGPYGSEQRRQRDPLVLLQSANGAALPYIFQSCGKEEPLLPANIRFARALATHGVASQFEMPEGGHSWAQWNTELPRVMQALRQHVP